MASWPVYVIIAGKLANGNSDFQRLELDINGEDGIMTSKNGKGQQLMV